MKSKEFIKEMTTAGGMATVSTPLGSTLTRNASIYGTPKKKKKVKESDPADTQSRWLVTYGKHRDTRVIRGEKADVERFVLKNLGRLHNIVPASDPMPDNHTVL